MFNRSRYYRNWVLEADKTRTVKPNKTLNYAFPDSFNGYRLRTVSDFVAKLTASFRCE